jgi:hypothetical protein
MLIFNRVKIQKFLKNPTKIEEVRALPWLAGESLKLADGLSTAAGFGFFKYLTL